MSISLKGGISYREAWEMFLYFFLAHAAEVERKKGSCMCADELGLHCILPMKKVLTCQTLLIDIVDDKEKVLIHKLEKNHWHKPGSILKKKPYPVRFLQAKKMCPPKNSCINSCCIFKLKIQHRQTLKQPGSHTFF